MDKALKQRMVGAVVLIALAVIFIPMLLDGTSDETRRSVKLDIPPKPDQEYRSRVLPLDEAGSPASARDESSSQGRVRRAPPTEAGQAASESEAKQPRTEPEDPDQQATKESEPESGAEETAVSQEPEMASASTGGNALTNWFVQVGSFSKQENAVELRDRLRDAGYKAFTETSTVEGTTTHRVKVGPEMDKARAARTRDEIAEKFDLEGLVVSEP